MAQRAPELRWAPTVEQSLARAGYASAVTVLYSLLYDPSIDNVTKFELNYFPYHPGTRALSDDQWWIVYSVDNAGNVFVSQMHPRSYVERLLGDL